MNDFALRDIRELQEKVKSLESTVGRLSLAGVFLGPPMAYTTFMHIRDGAFHLLIWSFFLCPLTIASFELLKRHRNRWK